MLPRQPEQLRHAEPWLQGPVDGTGQKSRAVGDHAVQRPGVSALRDEGTSYHYLPPSREVEISKAGINAIESALSQKNIPYWEVKTWTTDGFYRETVEMVQYRKEEGCQVVEMECSALAACAKFRKVTWAMLLFSADTLADPHKYQEREWGKTSISIALELALDAVLSVVEE